MADIDHFFPFCLNEHGVRTNIDGIWNLVLACANCNRGVAGKFTRVPDTKYLSRLNRRNSYLIESHHPLRDTLMNQTGSTERKRKAFLQDCDAFARSRLIHRWEPIQEGEAAF